MRLGMMAGSQVAQSLHQPICQVEWQQRQLIRASVYSPLQGEKARHIAGAEFVDHHKSVFVIQLRDVENIAEQVLASHGQIRCSILLSM